ncbi:ABC transporter substrate-binding protein [Xinfangfangia sp. CPCC 101601]|uniref:ABC transporter substrate-binding protein n=1 Tax=Pseudogemmobacter lacusdianii TaxID=3069608 RepID=A0ABU0W188_9RHOB|nr:ABC transporter substrate-binding protein [Xinfangfangia sp. CPCC 101601]MDQ2067739.1 ABC transporter substrate-binding protein [Xinfangfangia sp. CPCC 101601]
MQWRPELSRRHFLGVSAAATLGLMGAPLRAQTGPKRGGHFRLGVGGGATTDTLDPANWKPFMTSYGHALHGYLTEVGADGVLRGEVAESWEASPDAKIWTFKLRAGLEFHNGKSLSAEDVIASLNHHRGEGSKSAAKAILASVVDIRADGPDVVVVELATGNADFPYLLDDYHLPMMPAKDGLADTSGVGLGGYVLEMTDFGVKASATRFANYWKPNAAWFDSIEVLAIHDATARTNALLTGQIHAMDRADLKTIHMLERNQGIEITSIAGTQHYTMPMLVDQAPYSNKDLRLALKYGIDRQQFLDTILRGYGQIGNDHPISPAMRYAAKDLPQRAYDPDRAKFHFEKAGLSGTKLSLSTAEAAFPGAVDAAVLYQQNLAAAGIEIDVLREPNDGYWDNVWTKKPWCTAFWSGRATEDWMFSQVYASGTEWNDTRWGNERFDELLLKARAELDENLRGEMYAEMQGIVHEDGGVVVPVFANYVGAMSRKIGHGTIGTSWALDGYRSTERWWFAEEA